MKLILVTLILCFSQFLLAQDSTLNIIDKTKIQYRLSEGKSTFYNHNYRGALNIYREVLKTDASNPKAHYGVAECQYALKKYKAALKHIKIATESKADIDKESDYLYGKILHRMGDLDPALEHYKKFRMSLEDNEKKIEEYDIDVIIAQCEYAKANMAKPVDVTIENLGSAVNSSFPEFAPCISLDGKTLVFTSRRGDTKGGGIDVNFDYLYYSDVYQCTWNEEDAEWNKAEPIPGRINTEYHDGALSFTPDGDLLIYRNIYGVTRSGDIYISKQSSSSGKWGKPKEILEREEMNKEVNSTYFESSASMTADGNELYFVSERPGGQGQADIYVMKKTDRDWSEPVNLGSTINTSSDEKCVFIHPSGKVLFFTTNGLKDGFGDYDIYYCKKTENGDWSAPINMGHPINTVKEEKTIAVSADGKTAYVGAYYTVNSRGSADIFQIDISNLNLLE